MYLYLRGISGSDVGESPTGLLTQSLGEGLQEAVQVGQRVAVEHCLSLGVVAGHDVPDRAQSRTDNRRFVVPTNNIND